MSEAIEVDYITYRNFRIKDNFEHKVPLSKYPIKKIKKWENRHMHEYLNGKWAIDFLTPCRKDGNKLGLRARLKIAPIKLLIEESSYTGIRRADGQIMSNWKD